MSTRPDGQPDLPGGRVVTGAPGLTVAAVARRLGVAPSTLRTWDRRYGLGPSSHAAGTHRRYSPEDLHRLTLMRRLTLEGVPPAEAARFAAAGPPGSARLAPVIPLHGEPAVPVDEPAEQPVGKPVEQPVEQPAEQPVEQPAEQPVEQLPVPRAARAGGGRVVGQPDGTPQCRGLARAAMALDSHELRRLLRESLAEVGVTRTWEELVSPVLIAVGERWARLGDSVDVEHVLSEAVLAVVHGAQPPPVPLTTGVVLLACAEDDHHTLPLHVLSAALAEHGVRTRMLGIGMPADALVAAVRRSGPTAVFLFAGLPVTRGVAVLDQLPRQRPAPQVLVGGAGWRDAVLPPSVRRVGSMSAAVDEIRRVVQL